MRKRILIISICVLSTFIVVICNSNYTFIKDGVTYALTVDGVKQNNFPAKGMYRVDTECENAICKWDYDNWKLYIEDITGDVSCDISFVTILKNNLNSYIINLSGINQGDGQIVEENGFRYEGKNPNNYIWFNDELWRIIGTFDSASHGQSELNLVKIIRSESLTISGSRDNNWVTSNVKELLNNEYFYRNDATNTANCYQYNSSYTLYCDYTRNGIKNSYRSMIKEVVWYLGGYSSNGVTVDEMYNHERGTIVYSGRTISDKGKIGLMYPSDYGYSVLSSDCERTKKFGGYSNDNCAGQSWIYMNSHPLESTITPYSNSSTRFFSIDNNAYLSYIESYSNYAVRPTLYLNENVYVLDGDGSITDPYIIAMDEV